MGSCVSCAFFSFPSLVLLPFPFIGRLHDIALAIHHGKRPPLLQETMSGFLVLRLLHLSRLETMNEP